MKYIYKPNGKDAKPMTPTMVHEILKRDYSQDEIKKIVTSNTRIAPGSTRKIPTRYGVLHVLRNN